MTAENMNQRMQAGIDLFNTRANGGTFEIGVRGSQHAISSIGGAIREHALKCGYRSDILAFEADQFMRLRFTFDPALAQKPRGRPRSPQREAIESLAPGEADVFDTDTYRIRAIVQSVQRATGRTFTTEADKARGSITVTRTDGAGVAAAKHDRWPFRRMEPEQSKLLRNAAADITSARATASYYKRKWGKAFAIRKQGDDIFITRLT